jgi:outer membrane protein assembly factor BamA
MQCTAAGAQETTISGPNDCAEPTPQSKTEQFRFMRSEQYDAFARDISPDSVIGSIRITRYDVFNMEDPKESNKLYRLANKLNVITRESVIRDQLLVAEGDNYNPGRLAESERLLRELDFLYDATVRPWRVCGNVVDVEVITRDIWTLTPTIDFSRSGGDNSYAFGISDSNILGTGKEVTYLREDDADRTGDTFIYRDPALFGSRWNLRLTYSDNDDGYYRNFAITRPFFSVYERWSAGARATQGKFENATWFRGDEVTEFDQQTDTICSGVSRSMSKKISGSVAGGPDCTTRPMNSASAIRKYPRRNCRKIVTMPTRLSAMNPSRTSSRKSGI